MKILGIETSCDETAAAVVEIEKRGPRPKIFILSNIVSSQISLHRKYGGVFPEIASRAHLENIIPVIKTCLKKAKTSLAEIDKLGVTTGPGLIGSLLVGVNTAKSIAYSTNKPIVPVNHLVGHIYSALPENVDFPVLALIVSGGHTLLVLMKNHGNFVTIGQTRDDAAGEAFDKVAAILGLSYPGGPSIEKEASLANSSFWFPRPMIRSSDFDFSFSGLKTAVLYFVKQNKDVRKINVRQAIARGFQEAVVEVLTEKTILAAKKHKAKSILLCGGVAANKTLRNSLKTEIKKRLPSIKFYPSPLSLTTDNAAMIAIAAYFIESNKKQWYDVFADANEKFTQNI